MKIDENNMSLSIRILGISGSLRTGSYNTALLETVKAITPYGVEVIIFDGLAKFPHFNPDLGDGDSIPILRNFREQLKASDGVLIASPEYAHGIPGTLKNALDWLVGSGDLDGKPVGVINATPSWTEPKWAQSSLLEVLNVMSGNHVVKKAALCISRVKSKVDKSGKVTDLETNQELAAIIEALVDAIKTRKQILQMESEKSTHPELHQ